MQKKSKRVKPFSFNPTSTWTCRRRYRADHVRVRTADGQIVGYNQWKRENSPSVEAAKIKS
mgnify:CR=1 FL=1